MTKKYNNEKNKDLDQGWAWVIMFAATGAIILDGMLLYCAGVIHVSLLHTFEHDNAYTSLIGSIYTSLLSLIGPLSSVLVNQFSCRVTLIVGGVTMFVGFFLSFFAAGNLNYLLLSYGIVAGTGLGLSTTPAIIVIGYFFHKKHGLAVGIVMSGAGVGMFIAGPLVQALINEYGLQGAFLILAAISSNIIIMGALMRPSELEYQHKKKSRVKQKNEKGYTTKTGKIGNAIKNLLHFEILLDKTFLCCSLQYFMWNISYSLLFLHLPNYAVVQGSTEETAALLITYIGITSTFSRILTGLSLSHNGLDPILLNFGFNGLLALVTLLFPYFSNTFQGQVIFAVIFGIYSGGLSTLVNPLCMEVIGVSKVASGIGTLFFIGGVGYLLGPPLAGMIVDRGGSYIDSFHLCGSLFLLASIATLITTIWHNPLDEKEVTMSLNDLHDPDVKIFSAGPISNLNISIEVYSDSATKDNLINNRISSYGENKLENEAIPLTTENNEML